MWGAHKWQHSLIPGFEKGALNTLSVNEVIPRVCRMQCCSKNHGKPFCVASLRFKGLCRDQGPPEQDLHKDSVTFWAGCRWDLLCSDDSMYPEGFPELTSQPVLLATTAL